MRARGLRAIINYYGGSPQFIVNQTPEYCIFSHGIETPAYQGVIEFNAPEELWDKKIEEAISYFRERNLPFRWFISPDQPPEFESYLLKHGLRDVGYGGMAFDLNNLPEKFDVLNGLEIKRVQNINEVDRFFDIWCTAFPQPKPLADFFCNATKRLDYTSEEGIHYFLGYVNGEPVATSMVFFGGGVTGLWWVTTLPEARGKGIGTVMSTHPLYYAKSRGYRMVILFATDMGRPIYSKIGFQTPVQRHSFLWMPS